MHICCQMGDHQQNFDELCMGFEDKKGQSHAKEEFLV